MGPLASPLTHLAELIRQKNAVDAEIAALLGRPTLIGHVGERIASLIFRIQLVESASNKTIDGYFEVGPLAGRSVNVKWYGVQNGLLDITPGALPDFYLVMTGPKAAAVSSRGSVRPWCIQSVFLFDATDLVQDLTSRRVKIGVATSVRAALWTAAEIYPNQRNQLLPLSDEQSTHLALFGAGR